jgi:hypothetical protein
MERLHQILTDLEQGKISADNAESKVLRLFSVSNSLSVDYLANILKRTLEGNKEVRVEFGNEEDNINYILDVCSIFKKELQKDYC